MTETKTEEEAEKLKNERYKAAVKEGIFIDLLNIVETVEKIPVDCDLTKLSSTMFKSHAVHARLGKYLANNVMEGELAWEIVHLKVRLDAAIDNINKNCMCYSRFKKKGKFKKLETKDLEK